MKQKKKTWRRVRVITETGIDISFRISPEGAKEVVKDYEKTGHWSGWKVKRLTVNVCK